jgi:hypothetical protein
LSRRTRQHGDGCNHPLDRRHPRPWPTWLRWLPGAPPAWTLARLAVQDHGPIASLDPPVSRSQSVIPFDVATGGQSVPSTISARCCLGGPGESWGVGGDSGKLSDERDNARHGAPSRSLLVSTVLLHESTTSSKVLKLAQPPLCHSVAAFISRPTTAAQSRVGYFCVPSTPQRSRLSGLAGWRRIRNSDQHCPPLAWLSAVHSTPRAASICASPRRFRDLVGLPIGQTPHP